MVIHVKLFKSNPVEARAAVVCHHQVGQRQPASGAAEESNLRGVNGEAGLRVWVAVKELNFLGNPRFPLKSSFKGDIDIESYNNMEI